MQNWQIYSSKLKGPGLLQKAKYFTKSYQPQRKVFVLLIKFPHLIVQLRKKHKHKARLLYNQKKRHLSLYKKLKLIILT